MDLWLLQKKRLCFLFKIYLTEKMLWRPVCLLPFHDPRLFFLMTCAISLFFGGFYVVPSEAFAVSGIFIICGVIFLLLLNVLHISLTHRYSISLGDQHKHLDRPLSYFKINLEP